MFLTASRSTSMAFFNTSNLTALLSVLFTATKLNCQSIIIPTKENSTNVHRLADDCEIDRNILLGTLYHGVA